MSWTKTKGRLRELASRPAFAIVQLVLIVAGIAAAGIAFSRGVSGVKVDLSTPLLIVAILLHETAVFLMSQRWHGILDAIGARISRRSAWRITVEGHFYFLVVPFGIGADAARTAKACTIDKNLGLPASLASNLLDRLLGLVGVLALSAPYFVLQAMDMKPRWDVEAGRVIYALVAIFAFGTFLVGYAGHTLIASGRLRHIVDRIALPYRLVLTQAWTGRIPRYLILSFGSTLLMALAVLTLARAWEVPITYDLVLLGLSLSLLSQVIPVTILGFGAAEVAGTAAYMSMGLPVGQALALVFALYLLRTATGLVGAVIEIGRLLRKSGQHRDK